VLSTDRLDEGRRVMTVCNACRYCEAYCPVFPAIEHRVSFAAGDLMYLANLCHNCGECLYACQYAPPHEFGINVPQTLARIRLESYEACCWPRVARAAFRHQPALTTIVLVVGFAAILFAAGIGVQPSAAGGDFYQVISHDAMVALFGSVGLFVVVAISIGCHRFYNEVREATAHNARAVVRGPRKRSVLRGALRDILTLRHLHGGGVDCASAPDIRLPWRRWFHHATFYGFALCFASTSVAAVYHLVGWRAPYPYLSLPVLLGTLGGAGLVVGPAGLLTMRATRDEALGDAAQQGLDAALAVLLLLTSITGLMLLVWRSGPRMSALLIVHLGLVLALFLSLPYGKFVHGAYRAAALLRFSLEEALDRGRQERARSGGEAA
jgi:citrate/tricarballylate utilization protein